MQHPLIFWIGFHLLIVALLFLDLGLFRKEKSALSFKESLRFTLFWISMAMLFNLFIYWVKGSEAALQFFTGYLVEKSLSIDNLFVFLMIFTAFRVNASDQQKVLFWGIVGAIVCRISFILAGVALIHSFQWMLYFFGAFLVITSFKFMWQSDEPPAPERSWLYRWAKRVLPFTEQSVPGRFLIKEGTVWKFTPLFLIHLLVEGSDILFALDSIPAVFAITTDAFIVYTSNIFAILGLRSLYFCMAPFLEKLRYFKYGLSLILLFVGVKMLLSDIFEIPTPLSLVVVMGTLGATVLFSLRKKS